MGYLIGRMFINKEKHFFVEGKGRMSFLYNDFPNAVIDKTALKSILQEAILFAMDFELITPLLMMYKWLPYIKLKRLVKT